MLSCHDLEAFMSIDDALTNSADRRPDQAKCSVAWEGDDSEVEDGCEVD
jgi:hypothetical protein